VSSSVRTTCGPRISPQDTGFTHIKEEMTKLLAHYDVNPGLKISADASSYGLGAVLLQKDSQLWHPIAYASRTMTGTKQRYV